MFTQSDLIGSGPERTHPQPVLLLSRDEGPGDASGGGIMTNGCYVTNLCFQNLEEVDIFTVFQHSWYVCTCAGDATGDDVASAEEEPHRERGFV